MTAPEDSEQAPNSFGVRLLKEKQRRKAVEAERDAWKEEALSHRRRLGIPVERLRRRLAVETLKQATESASDSGQQKDDQVKKPVNEQPFGERLGPAEPTMRKATEPELPAIDNSAERDGKQLGYHAEGVGKVDQVGSYNRKDGKKK